ncbi:MAG: hypothetical protein ACTS3F_10765 [Phycisphaerales bacterium]
MEVLNELRAALARSDESLNSLGTRSGVDKATLSRLQHGGGLSLANADKLARALGYRLTLAKGTRKAVK